MLDEYSRSLRLRYSSAAALGSTECQSELDVVLRLLDINTYDTERLHSKNTRRVMRRQQQTHQMALSELAVSHLGVSGTKNMLALLEAERGQERALTRGSERAHRFSKKKQTKKTKKIKRVAGGGAWRAFLHSEAQRDLEISERPDWKRAADRYRVLPEDEKEVYEAMGRIATWRHREGQAAFPITHKAAQRHAPGAEVQQHDAMRLPDVLQAEGSRPPSSLLAFWDSPLLFHPPRIKIGAQTD